MQRSVQAGRKGLTDTETLGIHGAIHKRLWGLDADRANLDQAIESYGRGFNLLRDYYNGENYALCLVLRAEVQSDPDEAQYDRMTAKKVRREVVEQLESLFASPKVTDRPDRPWMHATLANCLFALGEDKRAQEHEEAFQELAEGTGWMLETYDAGKQEILRQRDASA